MKVIYKINILVNKLLTKILKNKTMFGLSNIKN